MIHGESMAINAVLQCVVMYCLTGRGHNFNVMSIMEWVHMAWNGCTIGDPSKASLSC